MQKKFGLDSPSLWSLTKTFGEQNLYLYDNSRLVSEVLINDLIGNIVNNETVVMAMDEAFEISAENTMKTNETINVEDNYESEEDVDDKTKDENDDKPQRYKKKVCPDDGWHTETQLGLDLDKIQDFLSVESTPQRSTMKKHLEKPTKRISMIPHAPKSASNNLADLNVTTNPKEKSVTHIPESEVSISTYLSKQATNAQHSTMQILNWKVDALTTTVDKLTDAVCKVPTLSQIQDKSKCDQCDSTSSKLNYMASQMTVIQQQMELLLCTNTKPKVQHMQVQVEPQYLHKQTHKEQPYQTTMSVQTDPQIQSTQTHDEETLQQPPYC